METIAFSGMISNNPGLLVFFAIQHFVSKLPIMSVRFGFLVILVAVYAVVFTQSCTPKLPFQSGQKCKSSIAFKPESNLMPMLKDNCPIARRLPLFHASSTGRNHIQLKLDDEYSHDSTFMRYFKDAIRVIRLLFIFLFEQPGQFKYVEWPSFPTTLKTASLTLVLVAMLIVVLSSVDSVLSLFLTLILRRKA